MASWNNLMQSNRIPCTSKEKDLWQQGDNGDWNSYWADLIAMSNVSQTERKDSSVPFGILILSLCLKLEAGHIFVLKSNCNSVLC